jgi:ATP synthase protein I
MKPDKQKTLPPDGGKMLREVQAKEARKLKARSRKGGGVWFGLGMFGLIGWSVAIPTLVGVALGLWIDRNWPSRFSWTLMLLILGVILGSWNAWHWVSQERRKIEQEKEE